MEKDFIQSVVPFWKKCVAFAIDFFIIGLLCSFLDIFSIDPASNIGAFLVLSVYILYFATSIYIFKTTLGLHIYKLEIKFKNDNFTILKIILREIMFLTLATGIGFIAYLIFGAYWDRITGASTIWSKNNKLVN